MNFLLFCDKWMAYCKSLGAPCTTPEGPVPLTFSLIICGFLVIALFVAFFHYTIARRRPVTPDEFADANDRIIARMPLLKTRSGEDLHSLCREISQDLLRVTDFVNSDVRRCIRKYHLVSIRDLRKSTPTMALLRENETLRRSAVQIEILYRVKPFRPAVVRHTNESVAIFSTNWLSLLARYCSDNLQ